MKKKNRLPLKRRLMQLYCALLYNANLKGFATGQIYAGADTKRICVPGMNCYSCPGAVGACPLGSLQGSFSAANKSAVFYVVGILMLYGILFGRLICGWLCPFGLIQDLLHRIKTPKLKKSPVTRILSWFKYVLLVFFVVIVPILYAIRNVPLPPFCKYICPAGTLEGGMLLLSNKANSGLFSSLGYLFTWKFMLMVSILVGSIFIFRLFCRFICPLGALYSLFNRFSFLGVKVEKDKCTDCGMCVTHCKVDIRKVSDHECISCGECIEVCPTKAISWKGPKLLLKPNEGTATAEQKKQYENKRLIVRCAVAAVMLAVLIGAFVYYWVKTPDITQTVPTPSTTPNTDTLPDYGITEGARCYGYDLPVVDGSGETGETVDPTASGKLTVLNFWGTWCTPCVGELPYFDRIAEEYGDRIAVIAVHSYAGWEEEPGYIQNTFPDSRIVFARDYDAGDGFSSGYFGTLTGHNTSAGFPITLILDENGVILRYYSDALEYADLKAAVEEGLNAEPALPDYGITEGARCYGYDLPVVDGSGETGETVDPTASGKLTVLNFWGTWCTPCVGELPYFDRIAEEYGDRIAVIAVHSYAGWEEEPGYIQNTFPDSRIVFARDYDAGDGFSSGYFGTLTGHNTSAGFPITLILDENGVILRYYSDALEYADLKADIEAFLP